ncbi:hypothetical protein C8R48DRAFT_606477, partial [Suillus tomentosus]
LQKKQVVPVLLGDALPHPDHSEKEHEQYCRAMMLLFKPWQDLCILKGNYVSWKDAFNEITFEPAIVSLIGNVNVENKCKKAQDMHTASVKEDC